MVSTRIHCGALWGAAALAALTGCNVNSMIQPTWYDGRWVVELHSDECGDDTATWSKYGYGMLWAAYDRTILFSDAMINNGRAERPVSKMKRHAPPGQGRSRDYPDEAAFWIESSSYRAGKGEWRTPDCTGTMVLRRVT